MPRIGVSYDQVAATAEGLVADNISPTMKNVRERLGTGSGNTIHKHLSSWRSTSPLLSGESIKLPSTIIFAISREIERATSEARAGIENRLVISQAEANELSTTGERLEADLDKLKEQHSALTTDRDMLLGKHQEQAGEIERLTRENERERLSAEQARIEVAHMSTKLEMQMDRLTEQSATIDSLSSANSYERQGRITAEKEAAVLSARLEAEHVKTSELLLVREVLTAQVDAERQSAELVRIQAAKTTNEVELQTVSLAEVISNNKELTGFYESETNAHGAAEKQIAVLHARLEEHGTTVIQPLQSPSPGNHQQAE